MSTNAVHPASRNSDDARLSLAELDHRFRPALKAYFVKRAPDGVDADDLVQDVFARLARRGLARRGEKAGVRHLEGYLFQCAAKVLEDHARRRAARGRAAHVAYIECDHGHEDVPAERVVLDKEAPAQLFAALRELPARTRAVFVLHRFEALRYADIAARLGVSVSSVEKHVSKALAHLARRLDRRS